MLTGNPFLLIPETMPCLRMLKLEMCNNIQDDILTLLVSQMMGQLVIINYYHQLIEYCCIVNSDEEGELELPEIGANATELDLEQPGTGQSSNGEVEEGEKTMLNGDSIHSELQERCNLHQYADFVVFN